MSTTPIWAQEGVEIDSTGDMVQDSLADAVLDIRLVTDTLAEGVTDPLGHVPKFSGSIWFVDAAQADDTGAGTDPHNAKKTIGAAYALCSAGDAITIKAGTYTEQDIHIALSAIELWCEIGVIIDPAANTGLIMSGDFCRIKGGLKITPGAGEVGLLASGSESEFDNIKVIGGATGIQITGTGVILNECAVGFPTTTAYSIQGEQTRIRNSNTVGNTTTRGFYVNNAVSTGVLSNCTSTGHETAGYQIDASCTDWTIINCSSGGGDGDRVDNGTDNFWAGFMDQMQSEHHEHIYPFSDGEGTAGAPVVVSNSTTDDAGGARDDQDYWGDTVRIIPMATITAAWTSVGLYIDAITTADDQQWQAFFPQAAYESAQNGGNDWDKDETALTVADGTKFQANDLVWVTGTDVPDGEIQKVVSSIANVVTIVSETRMGGGTGLRYDYDVAPGANALYVVYRSTDESLHGFSGAYSAGSAKNFSRFVWHEPKEIGANGAMIMRMLNATDALPSSFGARAIHED